MAERSDREFFLQKYDLTERKLDRVVSRVLGGKVEHAEIYLEYTRLDSLRLEKGMVKDPKSATMQGAGIRAVVGEKTGYAATNDVRVQTLEHAAAEARYIADRGNAELLPQLKEKPHDLYTVSQSPMVTPYPSRVMILELIDNECRSYDPRIREVFANLTLTEKRVLIAGRDGWMVSDVRPLIRLDVVCIAQDGTHREVGRDGTGGRVEFEWLLQNDCYKSVAREAARKAILNLSAVPAPAGLMNVVLGPGWPGILLHEAVGHGLEGDFNRKEISKFSGRMGQKVASELCTVVDDGTIPNRRGSLNVDDEGTPTRRNVLIEKGILVGYMQDLLNAKLMGVAPTGNGRRESYACEPMPRMTNTFMLSGESPPEDIIKSVKSGIYAVSFSGGQVDITNGQFVFSMNEAYLIEDGKVTKPVKGATLIGDGPTVMQKVEMVGNDLALDRGICTCGKDGQQVPVGVGLPTIKVKEILVGGTAIREVQS